MRMWCTQIKAIDPITGEMATWCGPNVPGINLEDAINYCQLNGLGYCEILGELMAEIPCNDGTYEPDFSKMIDYQNINYN